MNAPRGDAELVILLFVCVVLIVALLVLVALGFAGALPEGTSC